MLRTRKRLAASVMRSSLKRVWFDPARLDDIKGAITKFDIKGLVKDGAIKEKPVKSVSRGRARKELVQRRKGRRKGPLGKKGKKTARLPQKRAWINRVRILREFLKDLRDSSTVTRKDYRMLYLKVKGGFFRSKRHVKLYMEEQGLAGKAPSVKGAKQ